MNNTCESQKGDCSTPNAQASAPQNSGDCCPIQKMTDMWTCAFHEAIHQVHVDILKAKIQKAWGAKMDKSADAVIESMEAEWMAMLTKARSKMDLKGKLKNIMMEGKK